MSISILGKQKIRSSQMSVSSVLFLFLTFLLLLPHPAAAADKGIGNQPNCPKSFDCGSQKELTFPYTNATYPYCGLCMLNCSKSGIKLKLGLVEYEVKNFSGDETIKVIDKQLRIFKSNLSCEIFNFSINLPNTSSIAFTYFPNITLMKCLKPSSYSQDPYPQPDFILGSHTCNDFIVYSLNPEVPFPPDTTSGPPPPFCQFITLPAVDYGISGGDVFSDLADEFTIRFDVSNECRNCIKNGQQCPTPEFQGSSCVREKVVNTPEKKEVNPRGHNLPLILGTAGGFLIVLCFLLLGVRYRRKWSNVSSYVFARNTSSDPSSTLDPEGGNMYFGVPIFSYAELQDATNNFDPSTELGDGGFGTVYLGKLKDGREVAVKRLYERNYKRVTQFQNEIEILTRLRHKNLVSLYGCTSSQSRELLLVYEYIPNGTVADHLHGDRANNGPLTWSNRIHIALETASALVYLHASEIIHRDVKTNNILLDQNFTVKVADFGLSRLFPTDKTHVSTAPQGTPGYVDPEYHQCYQLTEKSDVYSFGVVLAELISSLPAVDISRHRHEINLANLAVNKIQSGELGDFVDPNLGFGSDPLTERMITSVAEVAFRCLQVDKDMRPSMDEVLETLQEIADYKDEKEGEKLDKVGSGKTAAWVTPSLESEDVILLKNRNVSTPDSMTDKWTSGSTTSTSNC